MLTAVAPERSEPILADNAFSLTTASFRMIEPWPWHTSNELARTSGVPKLGQRNSWTANKTLKVGQSHLAVSEITGDGQFAFVISDLDVNLRLFKISNGRQLARTPLPNLKTFEAFDATLWPTGNTACPAREICVLLGTREGLTLLNAKTGAALQKLSAVGADHLRFGSDQQLLGAALSQIPAQKSQLVIYRLDASPTPLTPVLLASFAERVDDWALSASRKLLAVIYYPSNRVEVIDLSSQHSLFSVLAPEYAHTLEFSADEKLLAVGGEKLELIRVDAPLLSASFEHYANNIHQVRFNAITNQWFTSSYDGKIRIFKAEADPPSLELVQTLSHTGTANVYALSFTADGQKLLSSSGDQTLKLWKY